LRTSSTQAAAAQERFEATSSTQTEAPPQRRSTAPRRNEASSSSTQTEAPQQRVAFAQTESIAPSVADTVMNVVESAQEKGTQRRLRNQRMAVEELGNTTRIPEAAMRAALEAQPQPRPAESKTRSSSPMIQYVGDEVMEEQAPEVDVQYSRAEMRRMRRKQTFPQPYGAPKALNPMSASADDASGSSAALEYQRRLREEELLRLEHQRLVSQQLQAEQEEAKRGGSKTVSMETDAEKAKKRSTSDDTSKKGKKSKVGGLLEIEPMPMTRAQKQEAKKRQQEEDKAEKKEEKKAKKESKTEYFSIADVESPKQRKKKEEPKKDEEPKQEEKAEVKETKQHGTKIDNQKSKSYWAKKTNAYIIDQLSLHGVRIDPSALTGKKVEIDPALDRKVVKKVKKITKEELLKMLYSKLKISH
jgi:hypothetical protein